MNWKKIILGVVGVAVLAVGGWFAWPLLNPPPPPAQKPFFADWGAMIVAGDWRASNGKPSEVFDNGRRELGRKFISAGFDPKNVLQFSVRPNNYPTETLLNSNGAEITAGLEALNVATPGGCLIYFTSHGTAEGIVIGDRLVDPASIAQRIDAACGDRPTVVIVSACFAGQFIGPLRGPRRIVFTAARPDRSSFGCGEQNEYTFFDACILSEFDKVGNFSDLATRVDQCVATREREMALDERSEPQFFIGQEVTYSLNWK